MFASSAPVYVASGGPLANDTASASVFSGFSTPSSSSAAAVFDAPLDTNRIQLPTLIGEVTLKTRSMFRNRSGRPRSETRRIGEASSIAAPTKRLVRARRSLPVSRATPCSTDDPPATPPVKRYIGTSGVHVGGLTIGLP